MLTLKTKFRSCSILAAVVLMAMALGACSVIPGSRPSTLLVQSAGEPVALNSTLRTAAYVHADNNTADIYLSDLSLEVLNDPTADLRSLTGNLVHIHLFLMPMAGRTPIDSSACNFTVRHLVLTGGQAGMYSGGGFILPASEPGGRWFNASVRDATLRLARADAGFADRLGVATLSGSVQAWRDEDRARLMAARLESIIRNMAEPVAPSQAPAIAPAAPATR